MAVLCAAATGNLTAAGTWGLVDSTSYLNGETASEVLSTAYSATRSATFTPGAITIDGIAVRLSVRTGTTGTISVSLYNDTLAADVAATEVTINVADLPAAVTADINGGWIFFKCAAPVLLLAATAYRVQAKTSSASQVSLFRGTATTDDLCRALRTTTTQAPVAGDDMIIGGEYLSAGSSNVLTVTMNQTASTDYGSASTSLPTPAISISSKGILRYGVTAATAYIFKVSGNIIVYAGGEFDMGTTGTKMPRDSSALLLFDSAVNVDFGLTVRNLGTFVGQGLSRTSGKNIVSCKLNTDEAIASTSLGVDTDTGWLDNDEIAVASTTRTVAECESGALNGAAGASTLTVDGFLGAGGGLAAAHSGTAPIAGEIILLTRNVRIQGTSATLQAFVDIKATATVDLDWVEFKWLGSATTLKRGIDVITTTGSFDMQYCSLHDFIVASSRGLNVSSASGSGIVFSNNVTYAIANQHLSNLVTTGSQTYSNNIFMRNTDASTQIAILSDAGCDVTNNTFIGGISNGLGILELTGRLGTVSGNVAHANGGFGFSITAISGTVLNSTSYRNTQGVSLANNLGTLAYDTLEVFGNANYNIGNPNGAALSGGRLINVTSNAGVTLVTNSGCLFAGVVTDLYIENSTFGATTAHATADIQISGNNSYFRLHLINVLLASTVEVSSLVATSSQASGSYISSQKNDQTAGNHKSYYREGTQDIETTITQAGGHSLRMLPSLAAEKLASSSFFVAVANGATVTPSVYVREAAAYNGNRCRLIVKRNVAIGISADTVLDTRTGASDAVFELMSGTTVAATADGVMEFVVDADGTAATGYVYVDSFTAS